FYPLTGSQPYPEHSKQAGLFQPSYPYITFGLFFADFDNDGWPDLFVTNGHIEDNVESKTGETYAQPSLLFRNRGDGTFADASRAAGEAITQPLVGRGACRGDYDNDGKIDILLIPNIGPPRLLRNETQNRHHWWTAKLVGTQSNRNGFGAIVKVEAGGRTQTAYARSGSSYLSANDMRLHFGLGAATRVERVRVRWPSGREEMWANLEVDRVTVLTEGTGQNLIHR
ncbi:MAG TPA: CRTAC1 family protein, partial [Chthonomonadales bacterium]|nr:CRTAC1 family protein [Chthonomonadales bacterium]